MQEAECDVIEVVDLEEYACSGRPIPKYVRYFRIKVDREKHNVQTPISTSEILIVAGLDPSEYLLKQKTKDGEWIKLEPDQLVDLREPGIERFKSSLAKDIPIIVNGREKKVSERELSFSEIVRLAFDNPPTGENICFTITYRNGDDCKPEGTIIEGETINLKRGMIFNVTSTDKS